MSWKLFFLFGCSVSLVNSFPGYHPPLGGPSVWGYFTPPLIQRVPSQTHQSAMEAMVDLTNNLGVAILQDHSYSKGNFAFSPYGVASVLVVLYEGTQGESARQILTAVGFPSNKDIIRLGFRDIHQHLRSYFSHEGYLSGISLNKDSSSLKTDYKKILRLYGYDIDLSQSSADSANEEEVVSQNSAPEFMRTTTQSPVTHHSILVTTSSKPGRERVKNDTKSSTDKDTTNTTIQPTNTESISQNLDNSFLDNTVESTQTMTSVTTQTPNYSGEMTKILHSTQPEETESTTTLSTASESQDRKTTTTSLETSKNDVELELDLVVEKNSTSGAGVIDTNENGEEGLKDAENKKMDEKEDDNSSGQEAGFSEMEDQETSPNPGTTSNDSSWANNVSETKTQVTEKTIEDTMENLDNKMLVPQLGDTETIPTESVTESVPTTTDAEGISLLTRTTISQKFEESTKNHKNGKKPRVHNVMLPENKSKISRNTFHVEEDLSKRIRSIINTKAPLWLGGSTKKPSSRIKRTFTDYLKSPRIPDLSLQLQNGMYDTHISRNAGLYKSLPRLLFLVDGTVDTPVPMMTYTHVFPYAYIPRLHAKALEFPLDDIRYKLLLLLPIERRGLRQLIYDLVDFPLRKVLISMEPTRVKAMVPTFMVEGFVILTSSLQKLGITDVFDPRKANLSAMSSDPELFVRNVEQSVTVVIRNYVEILDIQTRTMAARQMEHDFEATHPFLYFVLDTATNTALMAGQILDPLNSRIY